MSDKELEEYIKKVDPNFNSHLENGTIEMSNEYYNLLEERMARIINENKQLKDNWNKIKNIIETERMTNWLPGPMFLTDLILKMQELENGDSNE